MPYAAGSVVVLKSGGQPMTVVSASDDDIECVWLGEEGEFFRQTIPAIALEAAPGADAEDEDDAAEQDEVAEDDAAEHTAKKERAA